MAFYLPMAFMSLWKTLILLEGRGFSFSLQTRGREGELKNMGWAWISTHNPYKQADSRYGPVKKPARWKVQFSNTLFIV
jgi:hypothetical protein